MNKYYYKIASLQVNFFLLIPTLLILGPFLPDLLITLTVILFIFTYINLNQFNFLSFLKENDLFKWSIILFIYLLLNSLFNFLSQDLITFEKFKSYFSRSLFFFRFIIYPIAIIYLIKTYNLKFEKRIVYFALISLLFVNLDTIYQYIFGEDIFGFQPIERGNVAVGRLSGPFGEELIPGSYLLRFLFPSFLFIYSIFNKNHKLLILSFYLLNFVTILLSGERSALLLCIFGLFLFFIFFKDFRKIFSVLLIFLITISTYILIDNPILKKKVIDQTLFNAGISNEWGKSDANYLDLLDLKESRLIDSHYGAHWEVAYRIWEENKLIGIGLKQFREKCSDPKYDKLKSALRSIRCATHPHNQYFEILSEIGLFGLFIFLVIFYKTLNICRKSLNDNVEIKFLTISIILLIWPLIPTGSIFTNHKLIYITYLFTLLLISSKLKFSKLIK